VAHPRLIWKLLLTLALLAALAGCGAPAEADIAPEAEISLPAPEIRLERVPVATVEAAEIEPIQEEPVLFSEALADLVRMEYGERVVDWIRIDAIDILAPVTPVGWLSGSSSDHMEEVEWDSPGAKVGWVIDSALPGDDTGNIILYGHNNINSSVFRNLADLAPGGEILLTSGERQWSYEVSAVHILPVSGSRGERADYAQHLLPGMVPRLTLISCWPPDNNTHRVIVVAYEKLVGSRQ
jgi:LPXTG-site transpeptidase (sortase) family protein